jgi:hypothetical protein
MQNRVFGAIIGLAAAAAAGFRGVQCAIGGYTLKGYSSKPARSTVQHAGLGGYLKHPAGTVAQAKRAALKAKNRAKHRRACRG